MNQNKQGGFLVNIVNYKKNVLKREGGQRFIVITQARSGSTLLQKALHSHPDIICHGEVLNRKWINGLVPKDNPIQERSPSKKIQKLLRYREEHLEEFLENYIFCFRSKAIGFKLVYEDLFFPNYANELREYIKKKNFIRGIL